MNAPAGQFYQPRRPDPQHQPASRTAFLPVRRGLPGGLCLPVRDYIDKIRKKSPGKIYVKSVKSP